MTKSYWRNYRTRMLRTCMVSIFLIKEKKVKKCDIYYLVVYRKTRCSVSKIVFIRAVPSSGISTSLPVLFQVKNHPKRQTIRPLSNCFFPQST